MYVCMCVCVCVYVYRGRRAQLDVTAVASKKVSILEHAFTRNPESTVLLTALLHAAKPLRDPQTLAAKWETAIDR